MSQFVMSQPALLRCTCGAYDWLGAIAAHARNHREATAVRWSGGVLTFGRLGTAADAVAHHLQTMSRGAQTRVGVCMERSWKAVAALLGVLRGGCVYVPLDASHPKERLAAIGRDAELDIVLTDAATTTVIPRDVAASTLAIERVLDLPGVQPVTPASSCRCSDLAYVIYTSGTTGGSKGVLIERRSLAACLEACQTTFAFESRDTLPALASFAFDISLFEMLNPLVAGGAVRIASDAEILDPARLAAMLPDLTMLHAVPSLMRSLVGHIRHAPDARRAAGRLRAVFVGGDRVPADLLEAMREAFPAAALYVLYGPTESTIIDTCYRVPAHGPLENAAMLGTPLPGSIVKIVKTSDDDLALDEDAGELWIGGPGVARGYGGREELTGARFVEEGSCRYYRTGDLVRLRPDGNLVFLGRADRQIKIRGYRIEPGEVETVLRRHPGVLDAVVDSRPGAGGDPLLAAWIVPAASASSVEIWPSLGEYHVYDEFIYRGLTNDAARNACYLEALRAAAVGKVVVDVGTGGDAVLARLAVEAGARQVFAVELCERAWRTAAESVAQAGLSDRITVIQGDARHVALPEAPDVCVSEIFESIAGAEGASVILDAVRRKLKPTFTMVPAAVTTMIAAISLPESVKKTSRFDPVAAYYVERVFDAVGRRFDLRLCLRGASRDLLLSDVDVFEHLDLQAGKPAETRRLFQLQIVRAGRVDGFMLWLRIAMPGGDTLDTLDTPTAWFPAYVPAFAAGVRVEPGDVIAIECSQSVSADGVRPDYALRGVVRASSGAQQFDLDLSCDTRRFRQAPLYADLFDATGAPARLPHVDAIELRRFAGQHLPTYMIPARFTFVERLPLTRNGKVDRAALPEPSTSRPGALGEYVAPRTESERLLAAVWENVLDLRPVGIRDRFLDLGGHSVAAVRIVERVRKELKRELPLASLYQEETIERLVKHVEDGVRS
uniref:Non-ribosomal peptide synthetase n=1 Tax=uncultured bacterium AZ_379 TaxID=1630015 RepID=A0A0E3M3F7_9BACT|nr:non-ribosomal peptide synthetase [uncultured bacterium AZ_379]